MATPRQGRARPAAFLPRSVGAPAQLPRPTLCAPAVAATGPSWRLQRRHSSPPRPNRYGRPPRRLIRSRVLCVQPAMTVVPSATRSWPSSRYSRRRPSSVVHRPVQLFVPAQPVAPAAAASRRRRVFVLVVRTQRPVEDHSRPHSRKRLRGTSRRMGTHPTRTRTARPPCQDLAVSAERSIGRRRPEQHVRSWLFVTRNV